jgi:hypothetical protein
MITTWGSFQGDISWMDSNVQNDEARNLQIFQMNKWGEASASSISALLLPKAEKLLNVARCGRQTERPFRIQSCVEEAVLHANRFFEALPHLLAMFHGHCSSRTR